jgi:enoyl-CoA hydratase/carnithine racemase
VTLDIARYRQDGAIATVTLDRPDRLNTITGTLLEAVSPAIEALAAEDTVRAVTSPGQAGPSAPEAT